MRIPLICLLAALGVGTTALAAPPTHTPRPNAKPAAAAKPVPAKGKPVAASAKPGPKPPGARPVAVRPAPKAAPHPVARPHPKPAHPVRGVTVMKHPVPRGKVVTFHRVKPYHGVFVYGPRPVHHSHYGGTSNTVSQGHLPSRKVERDDTLAVGLRMGSLYGGYSAGGAYADLGLGFNLRYRPEEALGLELALQSYNVNTADSTRHQTVGQVSAELFAFPWSRVSPYVLTGVTMTGRSIDDDYYDAGVRTAEASDVLTGLHGGVGVEFAIGDRLALDLEGRYIGYLNKPIQDASWPGGFQTTAGLAYHF